MTDSQDNGLLISALSYAENYGYRVFPCVPGGKTPLTKHGVLDATDDLDQIEKWWRDNPNANIGIACGPESNLAVVDVDVQKGGDINDLLFGGLDQMVFNTLKAATGGGGLHLFYNYPQDFELKNSVSVLAPFIDVRAAGGYVIAPPSVHASGKEYLFINPECDRLLDFPQPWIERLRSAKHSAVSSFSANGQAGTYSHSNGNGNGHNSGLFVPPPHENLIVPETVSQGARNQELTRVAGSLRRIGLNQTELFAALREINKRICVPPLDEQEVSKIAYSVARYKPETAMNAVSDSKIGDAGDDSDDAVLLNTIKPFLLDDAFFNLTFEQKEILGFHIGKRDIAIIQAATNAGKTTLLRNVALCMAAGRRFWPFFEGARPVKLAYFDFENDIQDCQGDIQKMLDAFTPDERKLIAKNFIIVPKGLMDGDLFQFNTNEKWAETLIARNAVEFVFVDNVSAAYDLNDENSNAEVKRKIIKPLTRMALKNNCAFVFAHHYGKGKNELESAGVHAGRGASNLQGLSRTVINMFGDVSKGEPVTIECAKRKTDGGQNYREVFKLEADRWFHHTTIVPPPKKKTAYQSIREHFENVLFPDSLSTREVIEIFEKDFSSDAVKKALNELYKDGFLDRPKHGFYCGKPASGKTSPGANF